MIRLKPLPVVPGIGLAAVLFASAAGAWWWDADEPAEPPGASGDPVALDWEDLVPADFVQAPDPFMTMSDDEIEKLMDGSDESARELAKLDEAMRYAPVDPSLDGKHVTLPGYVVPLDYDGQTRLKEFLLVPYFGACIHTPPPPANQIVMAELKEAIVVEDGYEPIELRGILHAEESKTDMADAGYRMEVLSVGPVKR